MSGWIDACLQASKTTSDFLDSNNSWYITDISMLPSTIPLYDNNGECSIGTYRTYFEAKIGSDAHVLPLVPIRWQRLYPSAASPSVSWEIEISNSPACTHIADLL